MRHITIIGQTGQLGRALSREAPLMGLEVNSLGRGACDLSAPASDIETVIAAIPATDVIIIAAAYTAVDAAETQQDLALTVNATAPQTIGRTAAKRNIPVVHISTDYVFNGRSTTPYRHDEAIDPVNFYGLSKAQGEIGLLLAQPNSAILRTSWVYDGTGKNFLTTMLKLAQTRTELNIVSDQVGRPTYAGDLAKAVLIVAQALTENQADARGVFHVSNSGEPISWSGFARAIFETFQSEIGHIMTVNPIPSSSFPTPACRPAWSIMDISHFETVFNMKLPEWHEGLNRAAQERH